MNTFSLADEQEIFARIAEGDESAFSMCYSHYGRLLLPSLLRLLGQRDIAEEVIQEVFLKVWLHRDKLAEVDNPGGWLMRVTANTARDWLKKRARAGRKVTESGRFNSAGNTVEESRIDMKALAGIIRDTVSSFPPQRRLIYELSREEGLKPAEIAERLGISVSTVKNTLLSAIKVIREKVGEAGFWLTFLYYFLKR